MRDRIAATLSGSGYEITHSDLYGMNWNPVLSPSDFGTRKDKSHLTYALEQRHNVEAGTLAEDNKEEIDKVQAADLGDFTFHQIGRAWGRERGRNYVESAVGGGA